MLTLKFPGAVAGVGDDVFDVKASTASAIAPKTAADPATLSVSFGERLIEAADTNPVYESYAQALRSMSVLPSPAKPRSPLVNSEGVKSSIPSKIVHEQLPERD